VYGSISFVTEPVSKNQTAPVCHIFCKVIDNYGDIGVCWRLARQLYAEHAVDVTLWLDDLTALQTLLSAGFGTQSADFSVITDRRIAGVLVRHWPLDLSRRMSQELLTAEGESIEIVVETFACDLPETFQHRLSQQQKPPLWINLEYLSAEDWVPDCHGLISINPVNGMQKIFFFPGFVEGTGGLLREQGLLQQHDRWQRDEQNQRQQTLALMGVADADVARLSQPDSLLISVFTYETEALASWLWELQHHYAPVLCLIPSGRVLNSLSSNTTAGNLLNWSKDVQPEHPQPGDRATLGNLVVQVIAFQSQHEYDHLLSISDLNLVRGEDSFVRAQWAAKPMLWHIYPQQQDAHLNKLKAFLDLYGRDTHDSVRQAVHSFWLDWNAGADCTQSWARFFAVLAELKPFSQKWREKILPAGDIASNLMNFYKTRL